MGTKPTGWLRRGLGAGTWTLGAVKLPVLPVRVVPEWEEGPLLEGPKPPEREGPLEEREGELL